MEHDLTRDIDSYIKRINEGIDEDLYSEIEEEYTSQIRYPTRASIASTWSWQEKDSGTDSPTIVNMHGTKWGWPVYVGASPVTRVSSGYGNRSSGWHGGIDIAPSHVNCVGHRSYGGNPAIVVAVDAGKIVTRVINNRGYGNYVVVDHGGKRYTLYSHCHTLDVQRGQQVQRGQRIAIVGSTGNSTGPHLHFEVRIGANSSKSRKDPTLYINK